MCVYVYVCVYAYVLLSYRPAWTYDMRKAVLERNEKEAFLEWRRKLAKLSVDYMFMCVVAWCVCISYPRFPFHAAALHHLLPVFFLLGLHTHLYVLKLRSIPFLRNVMFCSYICEYSYYVSVFLSVGPVCSDVPFLTLILCGVVCCRVEEQDHVMTPFEKNLEVWRQLWRVVERSKVVVQIVDARNPLLFRSR